MSGETITGLDVVIVGAGVTGLYALHHMRGRGLNVVALEAGSGVGGTWYWNRYPGARVDIESVEYSYAFSDELQQDWEWSERYASQEELERYFNHVADRFDLRRSIRLNSRVKSAAFDPSTDLWTLEIENGDRIIARHCVMATGLLSAPNQPDFKGMDRFEGQQYHSAHWPREGVDFSGQRVGIVGTGSSGVQMVPLIAQQAKHLTVFQRTPAYAVPLRNHDMPEDYSRRVKATYSEWRNKEKFGSSCGWTAVNYHPADMVTRSAFDDTPEARQQFYEERWQSGGLSFYNMYPDVFTDEAANETLAEFIRSKIRSRVADPELAEKLVPKDYPVLTKRLCADTNYFETFNRDNVTLVDIRDTPIEEITAKGIRVGNTEYEFDTIVFATGFDAMSGALNRIDIRGLNGQTLKEHWSREIKTVYGLMSAGFPNLFYLAGPGSPAPLFQPILFCEEQSQWVADCIEHVAAVGATRIEPTVEAEEEWSHHCEQAVNATLFPKAKSWYVAANIDGKAGAGLIDFGGIDNYRARVAETASNGYQGFIISRAERAVA